MCGIVGYIGARDAYPILIEGLKRLEYRGYDSAGVALVDGEGRIAQFGQKKGIRFHLRMGRHHPMAQDSDGLSAALAAAEQNAKDYADTAMTWGSF